MGGIREDLRWPRRIRLGPSLLIFFGLGACAAVTSFAQWPENGGVQTPTQSGARTPVHTDLTRQGISPRVRTLQPSAQVPGRVRLASGQSEPPELTLQERGPEQVSPRSRELESFQDSNQPPSRLPLLPQLPNALADPPQRPEVRREYDRFVERTIDPELTLELMVGRPRILEFKETPTRIYLAQESIASYDVISDREIAVVGVAPGRTVLTIWVNDPDRPGEQRVLSYLLRVAQDAEYKVRLEAVFAALEKEINRDFPDSFVKLSLIGDQVVVRGEAKDVVEAAQILRIVDEHAPPARDNNRRKSLTDLSISQTVYSPEGLLQSGEELGLTVDRLAGLADLEGDSNVINLLKIPGEQQVMLRVTVAEVNRSALRSIGTNLSIDGGSGFGFNTDFLTLDGGALSVIRGDFRMTIDALKEQRLARTLAEPNLVTLHGRPARFQAGGQFPVPSARVGFGSAAQGVDFVPFGVQLQFVPFIVDRDKIRLSMAANVSTRDEALATNVDGSNVPGLTTRNFQNTVEMREGQTLAVAGLIQSNFGANSRRVPGLGDLTAVGRLFKSDDTSADEQELVILITPELVHPTDPQDCLLLPGADVYEPGDIEFFINGYLESRRSQDFRSPVRTDWARLKRYRECQDIFIIGPSGHSYGCRDGRVPGSLAPTIVEPIDLPNTESVPPRSDLQKQEGGARNDETGFRLRVNDNSISPVSNRRSAWEGNQ